MKENGIKYLYFIAILVKKIEIRWCSRLTFELHIVADNTWLRKKTFYKTDITNLMMHNITTFT